MTARPQVVRPPDDVLRAERSKILARYRLTVHEFAAAAKYYQLDEQERADWERLWHITFQLGESCRLCNSPDAWGYPLLPDLPDHRLCDSCADPEVVRTRPVVGYVRFTPPRPRDQLTLPHRIQRRRTKGWRKPPGSVIVDRTSRWGNPFRVGIEAADNAEAVDLYRRHLAHHPDLVARIRRHLRGRDLVCTCQPDQPCHADVQIEIANR